MAGGKLAGAINENQETASKPGRPCSAKVGMSGAAGDRFRVVTPKACTSPALIRAKDEDKLSNSMEILPLTKSGRDCARPL